MPLSTGSERLQGALGEVRRRVEVDLRLAGTPLLAISFIRYGDWVDGALVPTGDGTVDADEPVLVCGGRSFPVSLAGGVEAAIAMAADALVDDVMDELSRPWPQVAYPGGSHVVLEPRVDDEGLAVWSCRSGEVRCPIGYLGSTFGVTGVLR